eukprot:5161342-Prymnesium_polylepis.1
MLSTVHMLAVLSLGAHGLALTLSGYCCAPHVKPSTPSPDSHRMRCGLGHWTTSLALDHAVANTPPYAFVTEGASPALANSVATYEWKCRGFRPADVRPSMSTTCAASEMIRFADGPVFSDPVTHTSSTMHAAPSGHRAT